MIPQFCCPNPNFFETCFCHQIQNEIIFLWNIKMSQLKHLMCFLCCTVNHTASQLLRYWGCTLMSYFSQHVMIWNNGLLLNGKSLVYHQVLFKVEFRKHCTGQHWHYFTVMFLFSWCWALPTLGSWFFSCWRFLYFHQLCLLAKMLWITG